MSDPQRLETTPKEILEWGERNRALARKRAVTEECPKLEIPAEAVSSPCKGEPYPVRNRASLPRFHQSTLEEAHLLAASEPTVTEEGQLLLRLDDGDVVDGCPAWLIEMYRRASAGERIRGPMPMSFAILLGALVSLKISDRTGQEVIVEHPLDEIIGWCHPDGWNQRARDWKNLDRAFEELPTYRVTIGEHRFWVVMGEGLPTRYMRDATVLLRKRVPASAANGIRISWPQVLAYRPSALLTRAYLSVHALLDRSAHKGHPLTREIYKPILSGDGQPLRKNGVIVRSGKRIDNPLANKVSVVRPQNIAKFLGMPDSKSARQDARQALEKLHDDKVVEVVSSTEGYRFFGILPPRTRNSVS